MPAESGDSQSTDWFKHGDNDLKSALLLFKGDGPTGNIAFSLQQSIEKYIKGYLLLKGWKLQKIHDLETLLSEAIKCNHSLETYLDFARIVSAIYVESRYPMGPPKEYTNKQISEWLKQTEELIAEIKKGF
jgi:HEPN domain-containing protein